MSTIIYSSPIFGPIHSRRLGTSLGINLMPSDGKLCTFDCIYCECGFNHDHRPTLPRPTREEVAVALEEKLKAMIVEGLVPDVITFAGNGEPTAHPHFPEIIDDTIRLRDCYCPHARVSVLSNATFIHRPKVFKALLRVDNNIQKLDTVDDNFIRCVDRPTSPNYRAADIVQQLQHFQGHVIIQTMFLKKKEAAPSGGRLEGAFLLDNTTEQFVAPWLQAIKEISPQAVMVYTIDRETPDATLHKATHEELDSIRDRVIAMGIPCTASY